MNPPIDRENLRDALIALAVAIGLGWVVAAFRGFTVVTPPSLATTAVQIVPSQKAP
jgi:hypothetical protein